VYSLNSEASCNAKYLNPHKIKFYLFDTEKFHGSVGFVLMRELQASANKGY